MTPPLTPEAVAQIIDALKDRRAAWLGDGSTPDKLCADAADMLTTLAAENATLRAELAESKENFATMNRLCRAAQDKWNVALDKIATLRADQDDLQGRYNSMANKHLRETLPLRAAEAAAQARIAALTEAMEDIAEGMGETSLEEIGRFAPAVARAALTTDKEPNT
ncbi:hypothetical protein [Cypionkella sp. TWP1-2-1b2]|uniref:hypothetical protein n=1 Tax=Cypionkella sp. TWP1-2-1b2 TaxID=2804675 RepID=UPI003CFB947D